jgi:putative peptidoglycan lipid II flippase
MFPYIFFICLVALSMGILNVLGHFAAPALAPVLLNVSIIAAVLFISPHLAAPIIGLAVGVIIGGILQLLLQIPFLVQKGFYFWQKAGIYHPGLKKIGQMMLPAVFGAAVYQVNMLISTLLASFLPEGSVSYLYYADRLVQFPLGIFAISMSVAILPGLSRQAEKKDLHALTDTFSYAIKLIFFVTIPAMTGLIVLRHSIVALLFERGAFDPISSIRTADALMYFSFGLWAFSAVRIVVSTFYALQDTKTPVKIAAISVFANIVLCLALMKPLAHAGLALAASLSSMLNFILLAVALRKKLGALGGKKIIESISKSVVCCLVMGTSLQIFITLSAAADAVSVLSRLWVVVIGIFFGISVYTVTAYTLKSRELIDIMNIVKKG